MDISHNSDLDWPAELKFWFSREVGLAIPAGMVPLGRQFSEKEEYCLRTVGEIRGFDEKPRTPFEQHRFDTGMHCPCGCASEIIEGLWDRFVQCDKDATRLVDDNADVKHKEGVTRILELYFSGEPVQIGLEFPETHPIIRSTLEIARDWINDNREPPEPFIRDAFGMDRDVSHAVLCWLDDAGLIEHGSGIRGSWITETGRDVLENTLKEK